MDACGCDDFAAVFDRSTAEADRDRYRDRGPDRTTRLLLDMIGPLAVEGASVLDVGGGIGVIDHELLRAGAGRAVLVDASTSYLAVAREEADRLGLRDRMAFVEGDFVRRAGEIEAADLVTLDRVICCYADATALVSASVTRARRAYGLVLPRDGFVARLAVALFNLPYRLRRSGYRAYAHANAPIDAMVGAAGLYPIGEARTRFWRVVVYERAEGRG